MNPAPIALFVYARPDHTKQVLAALQKNTLASETDLIVFSDAAKTPDKGPAVAAVRSLFENFSGFRSIRVNKAEKNQGLARSIVSGISKVLEEYENIIVLEDDLVPAPYFLQYMNDALHLYRDDDRVISIHGYQYPIEGDLPETFFIRGADCWGWATWRRGWKLFEANAEVLRKNIEASGRKRDFNFSGSYPYFKMLENQCAGKIDSWAIRWYASAFIQNKVTLYPSRSLIENIGADGSGTHVGETKLFSQRAFQGKVSVAKQEAVENPKGFSAMAKYLFTYSTGDRNFISRLLKQLQLKVFS